MAERDRYPRDLATKLRPFLGQAPDQAETDRLMLRLAQARADRQPFYLSRRELLEMFHWKLGPQEGRQRALREAITEDHARAVTRAAFEVSGHAPIDVRVRIGLLCALPGVGVPVASAVLALTEPLHFAVLDRLNWNVLYGETRDSFSVPQYIMYLKDLHELASTMGCSVQAADQAMWAFAMRELADQSVSAMAD